MLAALPFDLSDPDHRAEYFRVVMSRKKLRLEDVADGIQMSKSIVSAALNGKKQSRKLVRAIATYLELDPDMFFAEKPNQTPRRE
ncbi:hypothetical protein JET14_21980 (plasmid) [Martelella lutilitoris]|uniref:HTH cro/C1-type domain-containing protein n=1 Tax=Martelella lutilitoris TaxID=2583532 RepID=A0A7T7KNR1_9HYPH|nr:MULTISPECIES: hypothetical protein [Martelella]QQM33122.1 hypothetical protein JET14_21980 [Martelella lutilitoris]